MSMGNPGNPGRDGHESPAIQPSHVCWQSFCVEISTFSIWNSLKTHLWSNKLHQISSTKLQKLSKNTWKHLQNRPYRRFVGRPPCPGPTPSGSGRGSPARAECHGLCGVIGFGEGGATGVPVGAGGWPGLTFLVLLVFFLVFFYMLNIVKSSILWLLCVFDCFCLH